MSFARSLTVFLSSLCLVPWLAHAETQSQAKLSPICYNALSDSDGVLQYVRSLVTARAFETAESCLVRALSQVPDERSLAFALARVIAWQGRASGAQMFIKPWLAADAESFELMGDLNALDASPGLAARFYRGALTQTAAGSPNRLGIWRKYIAAVLSSGDLTEARSAALLNKQEHLALTPAAAEGLRAILTTSPGAVNGAPVPPEWPGETAPLPLFSRRRGAAVQAVRAPGHAAVSWLCAVGDAAAFGRAGPGRLGAFLAGSKTKRQQLRFDPYA